MSLRSLAKDRQLEVITNIIEYLRLEAKSSGKPVYIQIDGLKLSSALEADLECCGLAGHQLESGCLIAWSNDVDSAKNCYAAEVEYETLKSQGPEGCDEAEGD